MGCESNKQRMLHLLRGDLSDEERKVLEDHLSRCPTCRRDLDDFRHVFEVTEEEDAAFEMPGSEECLAHAMQAVREAESSRRLAGVTGRSRLFLRVAAAAAVILLLVLALVIGPKLFFADLKEPVTGRGVASVMDEMVLVAGGVFRMGDIFEEGENDEGPVHPVRLDSFYLCRYEVTVDDFTTFVEETGYKTSAEIMEDRAEQAEILRRLNAKTRPDEEAMKLYEQLIASGGCYRWDGDAGVFEFDLDCTWSEPKFNQGGRHPVVSISWIDAVHYCNWLSRKEGLPVAYNPDTGDLLDGQGNTTRDVTQVKGYRLPTEAEWEFAARERGREVRFGNGKDVARVEEINFDASRNGYAYTERGDRPKGTTSVGTFAPNSLGIHDMSGNAWEWCTDGYAYYSGEEQVNPCREGGARRIVRGGRWGGDARSARVFARSHFEPHNRCNNSGFRLARSR